VADVVGIRTPAAAAGWGYVSGIMQWSLKQPSGCALTAWRRSHQPVSDYWIIPEEEMKRVTVLVLAIALLVACATTPPRPKADVSAGYDTQRKRSLVTLQVEA